MHFLAEWIQAVYCVWFSSSSLAFAQRSQFLLGGKKKDFPCLKSQVSCPVYVLYARGRQFMVSWFQRIRNVTGHLLFFHVIAA